MVKWIVEICLHPICRMNTHIILSSHVFMFLSLGCIVSHLLRNQGYFPHFRILAFLILHFIAVQYR